MNFESPELRDMPAVRDWGRSKRGEPAWRGGGGGGTGEGGRGANENPKRRMFPGRAPRILVCLERRKIRQSSLSR